MKIERIETVQVAPRWGLLRILTDEGAEGYGEYTLEGQLGAAEAAVHELGEFFLGKDPSRPKALVRGCYDRNFY
ncbi:MAG: D-galactonate dehydratase, partial [Bryobacteraceae bacterium]